MQNQPEEGPPNPGRTWWVEGEVVLLLALVLGGYAVRAGELSLRGEEPRRAQVAAEMCYWGDWIVPREQGEPFLSRPPLQNWLIAWTCMALGSWSAWAVRLHSVVAFFLTSLVIYGYGRTFLNRLGSLAAALSFATFGEMFQTGRQAETEALFIFFVAGSLLVWHWGWVQKWPATATWMAGYLLMALGALTKGPQAPCYFCASIGVYLLVSGQWRQLFRWAHLAGLLAAGGVLLAWSAAYYRAEGWDNLKGVWLVDSSTRFRGWHGTELALHLLGYPLEIFGCTLPWSPLLLAFLSRSFRRCLSGPTRQHVLFLTVCLAVTFPTCWISPHSSSRYFNPLYPCLALLVGLVVQVCASATVPSRLGRGWRWYMTALGSLMLATAVLPPLLPSISHPRLAGWAGPIGPALAYALIYAALGGLLLWQRQAAAPRAARVAVLTLACFMLVLFHGFLTDVRLRKSNNPAEAVHHLKALLPPDAPLLSLGHIDANFAFHYGPPLPAAADVDQLSSALAPESYFCFDSYGGQVPPLPFAWEQVAVIPMDRNQVLPPRETIVVGRRLTAQASAPPRLRAQASARAEVGREAR